ncbi:MAG: MerR family DNA-binding transcriptional regulator [Lachnospiraceae bacterium]|nr:MerR family DNA-binding transcriptional regulator [Lachnospiraceae bacterium]
MKKYSIGETAKMMGVSVHTLRYWTNEGLIAGSLV